VARKLLVSQCRTVALVALFGACLLEADIVYLKSGGRIQGKMVDLTDSSLTIDLGFGTTSVDRADIDSVKRTSPDKKRHFAAQTSSLSSQKLSSPPPRLKNIADSLSLVSHSRSKAIGWKRQADRLTRKVGVLENAMDSLHAELVEISRRIKKANPHANVVAYNSLVGQAHRLRADMEIKNHELITIRQKLGNKTGVIHDYTGRLEFFENYLAQKKQELGKLNSHESEYMNKIEQRVKDFGSEFKTTTIEEPETMGRHIILNATINRSVTGKFILDTGASTVSFSSAFADRLGVDISDIEPVSVTLADGNRVQAWPVLLRSVKVGDALEENIRAVVLKEAPGKEVDGLLGMSFLGRYFINIDSRNNSVVLKKLAVN
jgi:clan AA aspartic protease (TIGR02281 family)